MTATINQSLVFGGVKNQEAGTRDIELQTVNGEIDRWLEAKRTAHIARGVGTYALGVMIEHEQERAKGLHEKAASLDPNKLHKLSGVVMELEIKRWYTDIVGQRIADLSDKAPSFSELDGLPPEICSPYGVQSQLRASINRLEDNFMHTLEAPMQNNPAIVSESITSAGQDELVRVNMGMAA
jgi:hypothetical protein